MGIVVNEFQKKSEKPMDGNKLLMNLDEIPEFPLNSIDAFRETFANSKKLMTYYSCALLEVETKFKVLNQQFSLEQEHNPIETIKTRVKSIESIIEKLHRKNLPLEVESVEKYLTDVAGIRIICPFLNDIYLLADCFLKQDDVTLIEKKDYIQNPKPNGYRSLHLIIEIPIFLQDEKRLMKVEVQLRTIAMDFWASLEHKIHYKFEGDAPENIKNELVECARMVSDLDARMLSLNEEILAISQKREEEKQLNSGTSK